MSQIRVNINGVEINTHSGYTILDVARENGFEIPTLCQDDKLKHYGSCGMCVVEVENNPRLIRSCSTEIRDGMVIKTETNRIRESRKTTLELMLSNHQGDCKAPCMLGCPSNVDVQGYVGLTANKEYEEALKLIKEALPLPASIGRVCPHPCQTACRRGLVEDAISIAWIKRFVADMDLEKAQPYIPAIKPQSGKRIAVIGGGPGGLSAAYFLKRQGHDVAVYEAMPEFGGMLKYGIPLYRLPKDVLQSEIQIIESMGVKLIPNTKIGRDITLEHIRNQFDAVYVSIGAWKSAYLRCPGIESEGIIGGIEFLNKFAINEPVSTGNKIAVIGGGNTAMDACRTAIRLGAKEVYAIYRRTKADMPAVDVEIEEAEEEGVVFKFLSNPVEFISDDQGKVTHIRLQKMRQTEMDASGRYGVEATGEEEILPVDSVIMSVGQKLSPEGFADIDLNDRGNISINKSFMTNLKGVFAGGDAVNRGAGIAIEAIADGKNAAAVIEKYLRGEFIVHQDLYMVKKEVTPGDLKEVVRAEKSHMGHENPELRIHNFEEVVHGFTEKEAKSEASRCLECGCMDSFECDLFNYANQYDVKPQRFDGDKKALPIDDEHFYIAKDPNKCILCGMCVRICDEVMDQGILGFANRGFSANVQPAFNKSMVDTECISCGQCVSVCPTGALMEKALIKKPVPLEGEITETICNQCGLGCSIELESKGNLLLRSLPKATDSINKGLLCKKGRFDLVLQQNKKRIHKPMVRKNGVLEEVTWDEAILYIARKAQSINLRYGDNSMAIIVSGKYFNETLHLAKKLSNDTFKTDHVYANKGYKKGLKEVLGYDASTNIVTELEYTDMIVAIGTDFMNKQPVLGVRIKKAVQKDVRLVVINNQATSGDQLAEERYYNHNLDLLKGVAKCLLEKTKFNSGNNLLDFIDSIEHVEVTSESEHIASQLLEKKNVMFVFDRTNLSDEAVQLIAEIAVISGHIGRPRNGVIQLRDQGNIQGMVDMGINMNTYELERKIQSNKIKGLLIMDDNISVKLGDSLEFIMIQAEYESPLTKYADVVMPSPTHAESDGVITSQDRRVQRVQSAVVSKTLMSNTDQLQEIMRVFDNYKLVRNESILEEIGKAVPEYLHVAENINNDSYWPFGGSRVLYEIRFNTKNGLANFYKISEDVMYNKTVEKVEEINSVIEVN
ncbi:2Fe-2S iron-sulfur cluster binding domain-containing protein [Acidaminobacter sp. JC074]|uniref:molybdopterin-dependent oxidoreductase n=1 Tax=Acidaminobacter sp. JC074 TaxID=2530199 RepID=UPI001F0D6DF2|nr:molybdopterin-dependent oxidoreductase [Acidaminobacter sp. JC074]MCH4891096.1 2Fe-2S iron-sulfur cluster binding domain-containing protein [Acidaminobacter sp. JC074]